MSRNFINTVIPFSFLFLSFIIMCLLKLLTYLVLVIIADCNYRMQVVESFLLMKIFKCLIN